MGSKTRARQAMQAAGVPIIPGTTDPVGSADEVVALGEEIGYPLLIKAAAGGGGKGMKIVYSADEAAQAFESAPREGLLVLRRRVGVRREVPRGSAPRRGAGARRRARQRHPPRRARLHDPAPPPEARRGDAVARRRPRAARPDRADRRRCGARGRLPLGGDDRGPARPRRLLLLHGDEHPHPGRAHDHRARLRRRHRARADPDRGGRAARSSRRTRSSSRATRSSAGSTPRMPSHGFLPSPGTITLYREPSGPGVRVDSAVDGGLGGLAALRPDDREADRARRRPRGRDRPDAARARRVRDRRREDAHRLPQGAALAARASAPARPATASSSRRSSPRAQRSWRPSRAGAVPRSVAARTVEPHRRRRGRRPARRGEGGRARAAVTASSRAGGASASRPARAAGGTDRSSARCREPSST